MIFFVLLAMALVHQLIIAPRQVQQDYEVEIKAGVNGVVISKTVDSFNLAQSFLVFRDSKRYLPAYSNGLWTVVWEGDSVIKYPGDTFYTIYSHYNFNDSSRFIIDKP